MMYINNKRFQLEEYKMNKERVKTARSYGLILPAEWIETFAIIEHVKRIAHLYYFILHDSDFDIETGELKKAHYHVLFTFKYPLQLRTVANYFSAFSHKLKDNSFERIRNIDGAKRYLVHIDNPEKHQYKFECVETNDKQYRDIFIEKKSKDEVIDMIAYASRDIETEAERKFLEGYRPVFQAMNNPYQMGMYLLRLQQAFRETFGRTK